MEHLLAQQPLSAFDDLSAELLITSPNSKMEGEDAVKGSAMQEVAPNTVQQSGKSQTASGTGATASNSKPEHGSKKTATAPPSPPSSGDDDEDPFSALNNVSASINDQIRILALTESTRKVWKVDAGRLVAIYDRFVLRGADIAGAVANSRKREREKEAVEAPSAPEEPTSGSSTLLSDGLANRNAELAPPSEAVSIGAAAPMEAIPVTAAASSAPSAPVEAPVVVRPLPTEDEARKGMATLVQTLADRDKMKVSLEEGCSRLELATLAALLGAWPGKTPLIDPVLVSALPTKSTLYTSVSNWYWTERPPEKRKVTLPSQDMIAGRVVSVAQPAKPTPKPQPTSQRKVETPAPEPKVQPTKRTSAKGSAEKIVALPAKRTVASNKSKPDSASPRGAKVQPIDETAVVTEEEEELELVIQDPTSIFTRRRTGDITMQTLPRVARPPEDVQRAAKKAFCDALIRFGQATTEKLFTAVVELVDLRQGSAVAATITRELFNEILVQLEEAQRLVVESNTVFLCL